MTDAAILVLACAVIVHALILKGTPMTIAYILASAQALASKAATVHANVDAHLAADAANTVSAEQLNAVNDAITAANSELDKINAEVTPAPPTT